MRQQVPCPHSEPKLRPDEARIPVRPTAGEQQFSPCNAFRACRMSTGMSQLRFDDIAVLAERLRG
jgi:hypothetical protein